MDFGGDAKRSRSGSSTIPTPEPESPLCNPDIVRLVVAYCAIGCFVFVGSTSRVFRSSWSDEGREKRTTICEKDTRPFLLLHSIKHLGLVPGPGVSRAALRAGNLGCLALAAGK